MNPRLTICALCAAAVLAPAAHAASKESETSASPAASAASAASASDADRTLEFRSKHQVPARFTLAPGHTPITNGFRFQARFAGQAQVRECSLGLPKAGQLVNGGETVVGTIQCTTDWQLYDNGLSFQAFENGRKVADGTLRPG
jgi:hypothetical protein